MDPRSLVKIHFSSLTFLLFNSVFQISNLFNSDFLPNFVKRLPFKKILFSHRAVNEPSFVEW